METQYWLLLLICVAVAVAFYMVNREKKDRENADAATWANQKLPLIYQQADASDYCELTTTDMYENALAKLEEHGNKWLGRTADERKENVYLWVWGKDEQMTSPDFTKWTLAKLETRKDIFDAFIAEKAKNAKGDVPTLVKTYAEALDFTDIEKNQNGER